MKKIFFLLLISINSFAQTLSFTPPAWLKTNVTGETLKAFGPENNDKFIFGSNGLKVAEYNSAGKLYGWKSIGINSGFSDYSYQTSTNYNFVVGGKSSFGYHTNMPTLEKTGTYFLDIAKQYSNDISRIRFTKFESSGLTNVAKWLIQHGASDDFSIQKLNTNGTTDTTNSIFINAGRFNFGRSTGLNNSKFTLGGSTTITGLLHLEYYKANGLLQTDNNGLVSINTTDYAVRNQTNIFTAGNEFQGQVAMTGGLYIPNGTLQLDGDIFANGNNIFTGSNTFINPIFANSTSTSSFSSVTGSWSNTGNLGIFSLKYNTKVGASTVTWNPIRLDGNGWVGIGKDPSVAFEVLGASKFNSPITATSISASGTITASNINGTNTGDNAVNSLYSGLASSKLDISTANTTYAKLASTNTFTGGNEFQGQVAMTGGLYIPNGTLQLDGDIFANGNNIYTSTNKFLFPVFANSTSTSSFSSVTGSWSNTGNLGIFSLKYNTKVGASTVTWNPIRLDGNGWVGIGTDPSVAFEVLGASKFNSPITATSISASGTITASNLIGIGTTSPIAKLHIKGSGQATEVGFSPNGDLNSTIYIEDTGTNPFNGGSIMFGSSFGPHAVIKSGVRDGSGPQGTLVFANRDLTDGYFTNRMTINYNGNVGIGTTDPQQRLHVEGLVKIKAYTTTQINAMTGMTVGTITMNSTISLPVFYNGSGWKRFDGSNM